MVTESVEPELGTRLIDAVDVPVEVRSYVVLVSTTVDAIVIVSVEESPVIVIPVPAVRVRVSVEESATGAVPDVVEIVVNEFPAAPV